jgi:hypothetical protein
VYRKRGSTDNLRIVDCNKELKFQPRIRESIECANLFPLVATLQRKRFSNLEHELIRSSVLNFEHAYVSPRFKIKNKSLVYFSSSKIVKQHTEIAKARADRDREDGCCRAMPCHAMPRVYKIFRVRAREY